MPHRVHLRTLNAMIRLYLGEATSLWATAGQYMLHVPVVRRLFREVGVPLRAPGERPRRVNPAPYLVTAPRYAALRQLHDRLRQERISRDAYWQLVARQHDACQICTAPFDRLRGPDVFDRVAPRAPVLGLLCHRCAKLLTLAGRDVMLLGQAGSYAAGSSTQVSAPIQVPRRAAQSGPHPARLLELTLSKRLAKSERQRVLLYLDHDGQLAGVSNRQLADVFGVDEKQIRTDLKELAIQRRGNRQPGNATQAAA